MASLADGSSRPAVGLDVRLVVDAIAALAWSSHPDGSVEFVNQRWHDYTGLSPEELHGWGWQAAFHPDDIPPLMERWRELLVSGEPGEIEARLRRHDGVLRWFLIRHEPCRDESGNIIRWYGTSTDIDTLKQTQEKLREDERELFEVAHEYDFADFQKAIRHVSSPGKTGIVFRFRNNSVWKSEPLEQELSHKLSPSGH